MKAILKSLNAGKLAVTAVAIFALVSGSLALAAEEPHAKADLMDAHGKKVGTAEIVPDGAGIKISVDVSGLSPGPHGIHIHEKGDCKGPDFKSAGGHLNPEHKDHGLANPKGSHAGDLENLVVGKDGKAKATFTTTHATLAPGPDSLLRPGGTALVIHAKKDDEKTNPAGDAGDRVACGVISPTP